ncbi:MAG: Gfo/Idh/MocA family oxidoreductase [Lentisphaerae bacterium]|nr:Gfo/Idh/MocA family oxidoreductase [Lentisphaerota bacterium]
MTERKVKVGVVGVGSLGQWHARIFSELPSVEFVGVVDRNMDRAQEIASRYKTRAFAALEELASIVEAVSVAVPSDRHFDVACPLLERGVHVLVEKPIADTTRDAEAMVALSQRKGVILQVGHVERFNPVMAYLEKILHHPRFIEAHRLSPYPPPRPGMSPRGTEVSVVLDLMIHDLEVILHLVRSKVADIHAVGVPVLSPSEDIANVRLSFENGCVANITASRISPEAMRKIRIFQEDAYISLDYKDQAGKMYVKSEKGIEHQAVPIEKGEPLKNELASFVDCVRTRGTPRVGGEQAYEALQLAVAICRKLREHPS